MKDNNMELCEVIIQAFSEDMRKVFEKEAEESEYLNQKDYLTCKERAEAAFMHASKRGVKILTTAIATHRIDTHGEDRTLELSETVKSMESADVEASVRSYWRN